MDIESALNTFGLNDVRAFKEKIKDCIWIEAVLYKHESDDFVYLVGHPGHGARFEIRKSEIVDFSPSGNVHHFGDSFIRSRIFIKKDALISRISFHLASTLPSMMDDLHSEFEEVASRGSGGPYDGSMTYRSGPGKEPSPSPSPTPKPEKPEKPEKPDKPVVNVRG